MRTKFAKKYIQENNKEKKQKGYLGKKSKFIKKHFKNILKKPQNNILNLFLILNLF